MFGFSKTDINFVNWQRESFKIFDHGNIPYFSSEQDGTLELIYGFDGMDEFKMGQPFPILSRWFTNKVISVCPIRLVRMSEDNYRSKLINHDALTIDCSNILIVQVYSKDTPFFKKRVSSSGLNNKRDREYKFHNNPHININGESFPFKNYTFGYDYSLYEYPWTTRFNLVFSETIDTCRASQTMKEFNEDIGDIKKVSFGIISYGGFVGSRHRRASDFPISVRFDRNGNVLLNPEKTYCECVITCSEKSEQPRSQNPLIDDFDEDFEDEDYEYNYEKEFITFSSDDFKSQIEIRSHGMDMNDGMFGVWLKDIITFEGNWIEFRKFLRKASNSPNESYKAIANKRY